MKLTAKEVEEAKRIHQVIEQMLRCIPPNSDIPTVMAITTSFVEHVCEHLHINPQKIVDCIKAIDEETAKEEEN